MKAVGLMAGTSLDGIDAALVDIKRSRWSVSTELHTFITVPYSGETVRLVLEASDAAKGTVDKVARLNFYLGELFGEAANRVIKKSGIDRSQIELVASHGQTIHHLPAPEKMGKYKVRATMQIAEPSVIAARTGITTVADFRPADIAAGGEGAPLVPYADMLMFRSPKRSRFLVNIGGISNGTILPAGETDPDRVLASDIGPGNMVINELVCRMTNFKEDHDRGGRYAARGETMKKLLNDLVAHGFFKETPPKSTGRERFGTPYVDAILEGHPSKSRKDYLDLIATATALTARTIHEHYQDFYAEKHPVDEVIVSGGGARNITLMRMLAEMFSPVPVATSGEYGVPSFAKEAIAFAVLGMETLKGRPANVPGATGAKRRAVLGKIVPPP